MTKPLIQYEWSESESLEQEFLDIPQYVYDNDPLWPGEDSMNIKHQFSKSNPWLATGKVWIGYIREEARIAGFCSVTESGEVIARFGFWETNNTFFPNKRLFSALSRWAHRQGATMLIGPINFSTLGKYRLRLDNPRFSPFYGEPYNPSWYQTILTRLGFSQIGRYFSVFDQTLTVRSLALPSQTEDYIAEHNITLKPLSPLLWDKHQENLYKVITNSFSKNLGWTSCKKDFFDWNFNKTTIRSFCHAPGSCLVFDSSEQIIGLLFNLIDNTYQAGILKTIMITPKFRRSLLYPALLKQFINSCGPNFPYLGTALVNLKGPVAATALKACHSPKKWFHYYGLFNKDIRNELL